VDWFGPYSTEAQVDPSGPLSASNRQPMRVVRGGSFFVHHRATSSANRFAAEPDLLFLGPPPQRKFFRTGASFGVRLVRAVNDGDGI
jgi:hypothetical protein